MPSGRELWQLPGSRNSLGWKSPLSLKPISSPRAHGQHSPCPQVPHPALLWRHPQLQIMSVCLWDLWRFKHSLTPSILVSPSQGSQRQIQSVHGHGTGPLGDKAGTDRVAPGTGLERRGEFHTDDFNAHFLPVLAWSWNIQRPRLGMSYFLIPNVKTAASSW